MPPKKLKPSEKAAFGERSKKDEEEVKPLKLWKKKMESKTKTDPACLRLPERPPSASVVSGSGMKAVDPLQPDLLARAGIRSAPQPAVVSLPPATKPPFGNPTVVTSLSTSSVKKSSAQNVGANLAASYEPSTDWFDQHLFHQGDAQPFFASAVAVHGSTAHKRASPWYEQVAAIVENSLNMKVFHAVAFPSVGAAGDISLKDFTEVMSTFAPPNADFRFLFSWFYQIGAPTATAADPTNPSLPYIDILTTLDEYFNKDCAKTAKLAFELCDVANNGYIVKERFKQLRSFGETKASRIPIAIPHVPNPSLPEFVPGPIKGGKIPMLMLSLDDDAAEQSTSGAEEPPSPDHGLITLSDDLNYVVARAVLRAFERVAELEVEAAMNAGRKGKKKKKNATPVLPNKRQFHISPREFSSFLSIDGQIVTAFLPYIIKCNVIEKGGEAALEGAPELAKKEALSSAPKPPQRRGRTSSPPPASDDAASEATTTTGANHHQTVSAAAPTASQVSSTAPTTAVSSSAPAASPNAAQQPSASSSVVGPSPHHDRSDEPQEGGVDDGGGESGAQ